MKNSTISLLIFSTTLFLNACEQQYFGVDPDVLVQVHVKKEKRDSSGSGFFVAPDLVVTAGHVVKDFIKIKRIIALRDEEEIKIRHVKVLRIDTKNDLALLKVENYKSKSWLYLCKRAYLFDQVYIARFTEEDYELQYGVVVNFLKDQLVFGMKSWNGWSGSPVINEHEECVESVLLWSKENNTKISGGPTPQALIQFLENGHNNSSKVSDIRYNYI